MSRLGYMGKLKSLVLIYSLMISIGANAEDSSVPLGDLAQTIRELLGPMGGVSIKVVGTKVIVDGVVPTIRDWKRYRRIMASLDARNYPVMDMAELANDAKREVAQAIENEINESLKMLKD